MRSSLPLIGKPRADTTAYGFAGGGGPQSGLGTSLGFPYLAGVVLILRFMGVINAAVWLGGAWFFTFAVAPAFLAPEMKRILGEVYSGVIAQMLMARYFHLFYGCGALALLHQAAECLYLGRALHKFTLGLLLATVSLGLVGGLWLQPKLRSLHQVEHGRDEFYSREEKEAAAAAFSRWQGFSQMLNILALGGLTIYFWRMTNASDAPRFIPANKYSRP